MHHPNEKVLKQHSFLNNMGTINIQFQYRKKQKGTYIFNKYGS